MSILKGLIGLIILVGFATTSCTSPEELLSRKQAKAYIDSATVYDFEKQYKLYFSSKTPKKDAQKDIDQGLYFLLQTALKQEKRYAVAATRMFYAYLTSAIANEDSSKTLNFVISATKASMENDELKRFQDLNSSEDKLKYLVTFWGNLDPDPSTIANEALLVFGRRLAYSLNNFEPSGFLGRIDDRSLHVMKYGIPTVRREVRFNLEDLTTWLSRVYGPSNDFDSIDLSNPIIGRTVLMVQMYFPNPSIEVWVYDDLSPAERQTLFFFGRRQGGEFAKLNSPEEIIPPTLMRNAVARSPSGVSSTLNPAAAIIASIYSQLPPIHPLINQRLMNIQQAIDGGSYQGPAKSMNLARTERAITAAELRRSHSQLAAVQLMEGEQIAIDTYSRAFRFINDSGESENLFFAYSNPVSAIIGAAANSIANIETDVRLSHSLETIDENGVSSAPIVENPSITIIPNPRANGFYPIQSVFALKADSLQSDKLRFRAMLKQLKSPKNAPVDALTGIIAYGLNEYNLPKPLRIDADKPQVSDIIFGYKIEEVDALAESNRYNLPFWVPEVAELPLGLDLSLYFEVYNLAGDEPSFVLNYNLQKAGTIGILRDLKSRGDVTSVFLAQGKTHKMDLTIELADLEEGRYNLEIEITDRENGELVKRDVEFVVIDAEKRLQDQSNKIRKRLGIKRE